MKVLSYVFHGVGKKEETGYPVFLGFLLPPGTQGKEKILRRIEEDEEFKGSEDKRVLVYILTEDAYHEYLVEAKNEKDPEGDITEVTDNDINIASEEPITLYLTLPEYLSLFTCGICEVATRNESPDELEEGGKEGKEYPYKMVCDWLSDEERAAFRQFIRQ